MTIVMTKIWQVFIKISEKSRPTGIVLSIHWMEHDISKSHDGKCKKRANRIPVRRWGFFSRVFAVEKDQPCLRGDNVRER
jgi:hypothetical protein